MPTAITVAAYDAYGNYASGYRGTVHFTSSDHAAILPADYTFVAFDGGLRTFGVTFKTTGVQSLKASDTAATSLHVTGSLSVLVP